LKLNSIHQLLVHDDDIFGGSIHTLSNSKVRELIAVKVVHTSLLNTTVVTFKVLPLGSYATMPASSPPFKTILELVLWNGLQSCHCITPNVLSIFPLSSGTEKSMGARCSEQAGCSNTVICLVAKNSSLLLFVDGFICS
jgi:hypothetical protein